MTDRRKGGRNPKLDPAVNRYCVRFTGEENKRLLAMFKQSGMPYMACFIKAQFFGQEFRTFTDDDSMKPYNDKLASLHSQFYIEKIQYHYKEQNNCFLFQDVQHSCKPAQYNLHPIYSHVDLKCKCIRYIRLNKMSLYDISSRIISLRFYSQ